MPKVQTQSTNTDPADIRRDLIQRIVKNLDQVQQYLDQLKREIHDQKYNALAADRGEWEQRRMELESHLKDLQKVFSDLSRSINE